MIARATSSQDDDAFIEREGYEILDPVRQLAWRAPYNVCRSASFASRRDYYADALAFAKRIARAMTEGDVTLLAGTDAGILPGLVPGLELHRELELLVDGGLTPFEALRAATRSPGEYLARRDELAFGQVVVGERADLLLLDRNPLMDIAATREIHGVIVRGRFLSRAALDSLLANVSARNLRTAVFVERVEGTALEAAAFADSVLTTTGRPAFEMAPAVMLAVTLVEADRQADAITVLEATALAYPDAYLPGYVLERARQLGSSLQP
jgi:hypothetical protein